MKKIWKGKKTTTKNKLADKGNINSRQDFEEQQKENARQEQDCESELEEWAGGLQI